MFQWVLLFSFLSEVASDLISMCCAFLLNNKDWEHLAAINQSMHPILQVLNLLNFHPSIYRFWF
jgi:hypothetical protein